MYLTPKQRHCWSNMFMNVIEMYKTVGPQSPKHLDHWFNVHGFTKVINSVEAPLLILLMLSVCPLDAVIRRHRDIYIRHWMIWCKQFPLITSNTSWQRTLYSSLNHLLSIHVYGEISLLHKTRMFYYIKCVHVYLVWINIHVFLKK